MAQVFVANVATKLYRNGNFGHRDKILPQWQFWTSRLKLTAYRIVSHFDLTMDRDFVSVQQARVASFFTQLMSINTKFIEHNDIEPREKFQFQQRLHWDQFVRNHKDRPLFRRHLRMSYDSFCTLLSLIRDHVVSTDERMALCGVAKLSLNCTCMQQYVILQVHRTPIFASFVAFLFRHFIALYGGQFMQSTRPSISTFHPQSRTVQIMHLILNESVMVVCSGIVSAF